MYAKCFSFIHASWPNFMDVLWSDFMNAVWPDFMAVLHSPCLCVVKMWYLKLVHRLRSCTRECDIFWYMHALQVDKIYVLIVSRFTNFFSQFVQVFLCTHYDQILWLYCACFVCILLMCHCCCCSPLTIICHTWRPFWDKTGSHQSVIHSLDIGVQSRADVHCEDVVYGIL